MLGQFFLYMNSEDCNSSKVCASLLKTSHQDKTTLQKDANLTTTQQQLQAGLSHCLKHCSQQPVAESHFRLSMAEIVAGAVRAFRNDSSMTKSFWQNNHAVIRTEIRNCPKLLQADWAECFRFIVNGSSKNPKPADITPDRKKFLIPLVNLAVGEYINEEALADEVLGEEFFEKLLPIKDPVWEGAEAAAGGTTPPPDPDLDMEMTGVGDIATGTAAGASASAPPSGAAAGGRSRLGSTDSNAQQRLDETLSNETSSFLQVKKFRLLWWLLSESGTLELLDKYDTEDMCFLQSVYLHSRTRFSHPLKSVREEAARIVQILIRQSSWSAVGNRVLVFRGERLRKMHASMQEDLRVTTSRLRVQIERDIEERRAEKGAGSQSAVGTVTPPEMKEGGENNGSSSSGKKGLLVQATPERLGGGKGPRDMEVESMMKGDVGKTKGKGAGKKGDMMVAPLDLGQIVAVIDKLGGVEYVSDNLKTDAGKKQLAEKLGPPGEMIVTVLEAALKSGMKLEDMLKQAQQIAAMKGGAAAGSHTAGGTCVGQEVGDTEKALRMIHTFFFEKISPCLTRYVCRYVSRSTRTRDYLSTNVYPQNIFFLHVSRSEWKTCPVYEQTKFFLRFFLLLRIPVSRPLPRYRVAGRGYVFSAE